MMVCPAKKCALVLGFVVGVATLSPYERFYSRDVVRRDGFGYGFPRYERVVMVQDPRGFWDFLGNWIQNSNWLPVEINIPDTFGSITTGISNFTSGIIQRIPFLNNNNGDKPVMFLLPVFRRRSTTNLPSEIEPTAETIQESQNEKKTDKPLNSDENEKKTDKPLNTDDGVKEDIKQSIENGEKIHNYDDDKIIEKDSNVKKITQEKEDIKIDHTKKEDAQKQNNYRNNDHVVTIEHGNGVGIRKMLDEDGFWAYL